MTIWSAEIKELEKLYDSIKGQHPKLDNELQRLIKTNVENIVLVYARRCLEVIITDLCERELKRSRGTEPLKGIIDKLNREEKVPANIITSMQSLNSMSTFGALLDKRKKPVAAKKVLEKTKKRIILASTIILVCAIIVVPLILTDVINVGKGVKAGEIKSLVILPFENYTGDEGLDYVAAGMHSSLIGDMGKVGALRVIGKTSSSVYRNTQKSAPDIARELNVDALMESTVTCYGDSVCIQIRLITLFPEEKQLWVADYREDKREITNLYSRITKQIANELMIELTPEEDRLLVKSRIVDKEAYDSYLLGLYFLDDFSLESLNKAREYLNLPL